MGFDSICLEIGFCKLLHGKLAVVLRGLLIKVFFLNSNNDVDAVLSTDLGKQGCFKFLIRQFVSLNKMKIICSVGSVV